MLCGYCVWIGYWVFFWFSFVVVLFVVYLVELSFFNPI